ncbi:MAG: hypothetical protein IT327_11060 [Anaerolineae bacterium]|nr:hypothetical protein [Anaerolineae bacterium]
MQWWEISLIACAVPVAILGIIVFYKLFTLSTKFVMLELFGVDTLATITHSIEYTGDGFHGGDPCFKGRYLFKDRKGKNYYSEFSEECYDVYDLVDYWEEARGIHAPGSQIHVRYVHWLPAIHKITFPHPEKESEMINWTYVPWRESELDYQKAQKKAQKLPVRNWLRRQNVWAVVKNQYYPPNISDDFANLRNDEVAHILLLGLERGFYSHSTIVLWADREILLRDKPEDWVIDLSLSRNNNQEDVVSLLKGVAFVEEETKGKNRLLLGILGKCLHRGDCIPPYFACQEALSLFLDTELSEEEVGPLREIWREFGQLPNPLQEVPDWLEMRLQNFFELYK